MTMPQTDRNADICTHYMTGSTVQQLADRYAISRVRVRQILRKAGIFKSYRDLPGRLTAIEHPGRDAFIGADVTKETKDAIAAEADRQGISTSLLVSKTLDELVK